LIYRNIYCSSYRLKESSNVKRLYNIISYKLQMLSKCRVFIPVKKVSYCVVAIMLKNHKRAGIAKMTCEKLSRIREKLSKLM